MGYPRLPVEKQCELAPTLLTAMEGKPQPQQDRYAPPSPVPPQLREPRLPSSLGAAALVSSELSQWASSRIFCVTSAQHYCFVSTIIKFL